MGFSRLIPAGTTPGLIPCCPTNPRKALKCAPIVAHTDCGIAGTVIDIPTGVDCGGTSTETVVHAPLPVLPAAEKAYYLTGTAILPPPCGVRIYATVHSGVRESYKPFLNRQVSGQPCSCDPVELPFALVIATTATEHAPVIEVRRENGPLLPIQLHFQSCLNVTDLALGVRSGLIGRKILEAPAGAYFRPGRAGNIATYGAAEFEHFIPIGKINASQNGIRLTCRGVGEPTFDLYGRGTQPARAPTALHWPEHSIGGGSHPFGANTSAPWGPETVIVPRSYAGIDEVLWLGYSSHRYAHLIIDALEVV